MRLFACRYGFTGIMIPFILTIHLLLLAACSSEPPEIMRIGTNIWPGYEPLYLARDLGCFNDGQIRLVEYSSASEVMRGYRNGLLEAAALTLDEVLLLAQDMPQMHLMLAMDISNGADAILARPEIMTLNDLQGKRIAVEKTALGAYMLTRALESADLGISDVTIVTIEVDGHEQAYRNSRVDAVVTFEPVRSRLLAADARQIFDSSQIPGEIVDVLVADRQWLKKNQATVDLLNKCWFQSLDYIKENPQDAAQRMSGRLGLSAEQVLAAYQGLRLPDTDENQRLLGTPNGEPQLLSGARKLSEVMLDHGLLQRTSDPEVLFPEPE